VEFTLPEMLFIGALTLFAGLMIGDTRADMRRWGQAQLELADEEGWFVSVDRLRTRPGESLKYLMRIWDDRDAYLSGAEAALAHSKARTPWGAERKARRMLAQARKGKFLDKEDIALNIEQRVNNIEE
jgi:hypothetical protein